MRLRQETLHLFNHQDQDETSHISNKVLRPRWDVWYTKQSLDAEMRRLIYQTKYWDQDENVWYTKQSLEAEMWCLIYQTKSWDRDETSHIPNKVLRPRWDVSFPRLRCFWDIQNCKQSETTHWGIPSKLLNCVWIHTHGRNQLKVPYTDVYSSGSGIHHYLQT